MCSDGVGFVCYEETGLCVKKQVCMLRNETEVTGRRSVDAADSNETHGRINDRLEPGLLRRNVASILE